uniref:Uncharacterized protein n=1 Tax=Picea glauca TaxID=3330 RepID=A0A101M3D4_PICGL|nr:hypothetical protein ABT39_MTgene47 [Picea glauca]
MPPPHSQLTRINNTTTQWPHHSLNSGPIPHLTSPSFSSPHSIQYALPRPPPFLHFSPFISQYATQLLLLPIPFPH